MCGLSSVVIDLKSDVTDLKSDVKELKGDVRNLKNDAISLENKSDNNSKALFDGYAQNNDKLDRIEGKLDELSERIDSHDIKIQVIESARR